MAKRLLVTGCDGFVAGTILTQCRPEWEVHAMALGEALLERAGLAWYTFDLREPGRLEALFGQIRPDAVIHAAAMADIDFCENNKDVALAVNVKVTERLVELCRASGARLVALSTDTVFDGKKGGYTEEDAPNPINFYAETKVALEKAVASLGANWVVARLSLVMGLPMLRAGNSFLSRAITALEEGKEVGMPDEEIRSPIDVVTLSRALLELAGNEYTGLLHLSGNDTMHRFEMMQRLAAKLGLPRELVVVKNSSSLPGRAPRPVYANLINAKAKAVLKTPMLGLMDGLELVMKTKKGIVL